MPTKSFLFPALFFTLLSGCVPHSKFASPSAVTIRLYARQNGKMNKSFKVISLTDKAVLSKLPTLLSSTSSKLYKCGYKGEVTLTNKKGKSLSFEYNTTGRCSYGTYFAKGKLHSYKLTRAGATYLKDLHKQANSTKTKPKKSK